MIPFTRRDALTNESVPVGTKTKLQLKSFVTVELLLGDMRLTAIWSGTATVKLKSVGAQTTLDVFCNPIFQV